MITIDFEKKGVGFTAPLRFLIQKYVPVFVSSYYQILNKELQFMFTLNNATTNETEVTLKII